MSYGCPRTLVNLGALDHPWHQSNPKDNNPTVFWHPRRMPESNCNDRWNPPAQCAWHPKGIRNQFGSEQCCQGVKYPCVLFILVICCPILVPTRVGDMGWWDISARARGHSPIFLIRCRPMGRDVCLQFSCLWSHFCHWSH